MEQELKNKLQRLEDLEDFLIEIKSLIRNSGKSNILYKSDFEFLIEDLSN